MGLYRCLLGLACLSSSVAAQLTNSNISSPIKGNLIDLGYSQYQGYIDNKSGLEFFLGIRYAATPVRFQAPTKPVTNRTTVVQANTYGPICFQSRNAPGGARTFGGSEDCLFLNVWKPANNTAGGLPVLVYIHGGGYGGGNGRYDPTFLQQVTGQQFVFVSVQYRLGAFGFLASADVKENGALNAGLLDQNRALQWVQEHISSFGGSPDTVTIFGESAGAGSVMLQLLSYGGTIGTSLFRNAMMASPYLPKQYAYNDAVPAKFYNAFAMAVGCHAPNNSYASVFACLSLADTYVVANASDAISVTAYPGLWGFNPVTDGTFLQYTPSRQLALGLVNGQGVLVGNNAHEGDIFTPANISTTAGFQSYAQGYLPKLNAAGYQKLLGFYPEPEQSGGLYNTQFERTAQFVADAQFVCPGEWIADAFTTAYRYEYAVPEAYHAQDIAFYLASATTAYPAALNNFASVFDSALVSFIFNNKPTLTTGQQFPMWGTPTYGTQALFNVSDAQTTPATYVGLSTNNAISGMPNVTIENGVQYTNGNSRCDFWRSIAPIVPM